MNSSKIVLNTSASFSSLRIENPKKAGPLSKESENNLKLFLNKVPLVDELFQIQDMVGEGTFSKVYKAKHKQSQNDFALKCVIPTIKPNRIIPELRYLRDLGGDSNIIEIKTCLFDSGYTVIVMPYFQHDRFSDYIKDMNLDEIKDYMRNLLIALRKVHQDKIIHRDVKPNNFLYNRNERKFALVDFGLAQYEVDVLKASKVINRLQSNIINNNNNNNNNNLNKKSHHHHNHHNHHNNNHQHNQQLKLTSNSSKQQQHQHNNNNQQENSQVNKPIATANTLFKNKSNDKLILIKKRLLTENDDENVLPRKFKKFKSNDSPLKNQSSLIYKSSIFNTPITPTFLNQSIQQTNQQHHHHQQQHQQQQIVCKAMMNMTNLQNTPTNTLINSQQQQSITPLCFNAIPNFNFNTNFDPASKLLTPDNSSLISNYQLTNQMDPFKTPTKQQKNQNSNTPSNVLGQLQNSPNSIIPETPPKSSNRLDSLNNSTNVNTKRKVPALNFSKLNSPSSTVSTNYHKSKSINKSANSLSNSLANVNLNCKCFGSDQICKICTKRNECMAPRAGTPGFRAPEVLLKHLCQTSSIDIWSAGVIFASLLTKKYPFFKNTDDMTSLAEIISIFGTERVEKAALLIGKQIISSEKVIEPINLKENLIKLRGDQMEIEDSAFDLLDKLLDPNPLTRINAIDALNHSFLSK